MDKKRELLPFLDDAITGFARLTEHCAKLEIVDNSTASQKLKGEFNDLMNNEVKKLKEAIYTTRSEIIRRPKKKDGRSSNPGRPGTGKTAAVANEEDIF